MTSITQLNIHIRWIIYSFLPMPSHSKEGDDSTIMIHYYVIVRQWYVSAMMGDLEMLQELWSQAQDVYQNIPMESTRNVLQKMYLRNCWNAMLCNILARYGHIRCLQWVVSMGCPWNVHECCIEADRSGYMNIVQWITTTYIDDPRSLK